MTQLRDFSKSIELCFDFNLKIKILILEVIETQEFCETSGNGRQSEGI